MGARILASATIACKVIKATIPKTIHWRRSIQQLLSNEAVPNPSQFMEMPTLPFHPLTAFFPDSTNDCNYNFVASRISQINTTRKTFCCISWIPLNSLDMCQTIRYRIESKKSKIIIQTKMLHCSCMAWKNMLDGIRKQSIDMPLKWLWLNYKSWTVYAIDIWTHLMMSHKCFYNSAKALARNYLSMCGYSSWRWNSWVKSQFLWIFTEKANFFRH